MREEQRRRVIPHNTMASYYSQEVVGISLIRGLSVMIIINNSLTRQKGVAFIMYNVASGYSHLY